MDITIKNNDAYRELCKILSVSQKDLKDQIISKLIKIEFLSEHEQEVGKTIQEIIDEYGEFYLIKIVTELFPLPSDYGNIEVQQFTSSLVIWGCAYDNPCSECGCEMEVESESLFGKTWKNYSCTNSECDGGHSNEPDWETIPGGRKS